MRKILVTGAAGFIGSHTVKRLCKDGYDVIGIDNLNNYYDPSLKISRLENIKHENFNFIKMNIADKNAMEDLFKNNDFNIVIHLAAQAGVRYSIENPDAYTESNLIGFMNILECCRKNNIEHLVYASSSSVYGMNDEMPFDEEQKTDSPLSLYAATKKSNEMLAHSYSHLYKMNTTGLRFFTVYGEWGRPDMAPFLFTKAIENGETINVFNNGQMERDFTYIDDIVDGIVKVKDVLPSNKKMSGLNESNYYSVYNIGNNKPEKLEDFISCIEKNLEKKAIKNYMPMQNGDVVKTFANTDSLNYLVGYKPRNSMEEGLKKFIDWYKKYYRKI